MMLGSFSSWKPEVFDPCCWSAGSGVGSIGWKQLRMPRTVQKLPTSQVATSCSFLAGFLAFSYSTHMAHGSYFLGQEPVRSVTHAGSGPYPNSKKKVTCPITNTVVRGFRIILADEVSQAAVRQTKIKLRHGGES